MRRVSFALALTLVLSFGLVYGQTGFRVEFTPLITDYAATNFAASGAGITVNVYHTNSQMRTGWSTPFAFYGTGTVQITGPGTHMANPGVFDNTLWSMGTFESEESWDGDLTTGNTSFGPGEHWNFSGLTLSGYQAGPELLAFIFTFTFDADDDDNCETIEGQFCIDSGDFDDNTYDWLFDPAEPFGGPYCVDVKKPCDLPPEITNCPQSDVVMQWDEQYGYQFTFVDPDATGGYVWAVISGPGQIDQNGYYTNNPDCSEVGSHTVCIELCDGAGGCDTCCFTKTVLNTAPVIGGDCNETFTIGTNTVNPGLAQFNATDANVGDVLTFSLCGIMPDDGNVVVTVNQDGSVDVECLGEEGVYDICIRVTDCNGDYDECWFTVIQVGKLPFDIVIEKEHGPTGLGVLQGHHVYVDVKKMRGTNEMHGFDFLIGYDASALTFIGAEQGQILTDLEWEYFTYRYNWNGNCGNACPSGLLRVVAMGETNDGPHHPLGFVIPDGSVLFTMDFLVTNDRNFGCMFVPIYFYWHDCGDNTIAMYDPTTPEHDIQTAVSEHVFHYGGTLIYYGEPYYEVTDMFWGFPTMFGVQWECLEGGGPDKPAPIPFIWFFGGGVDIICPDDIDDRGDINLNGVSNEIADAVVFTNYFVYGLAAFVVNVEGQIAATEVNGDGMVLTVADLVYLIRVIVGDVLPIPKATPVGDLQVVAGDAITFDREVGAAAFVFEGNVDLSLADGAAGMELASNFRDGMTYALIYSFDPGVTASGEVLNVNGGNLVSVEAADYVAGSLNARILPSNFELAQNAPNPFNMSTSIKMALPVASDWTLSVYNVAGQRVLDYGGYSEAGTMTINVDMTGLGSGIYFYKAVAGEFSATKKMVLLK
jgi:hypothetical protein